MAGQSLLPAFQAGHGDSIPVAPLRLIQLTIRMRAVYERSSSFTAALSLMPAGNSGRCRSGWPWRTTSLRNSWR